MEDTIAAIATAYGEGGIGIIRISGSESLSILNKIFVPFKKLEIESRRMTYGTVKDPADGSIIDEVLAVYMKKPSTYTAEDVVEINCHGSIISLKKTLELVLREGARMAEPGEFTKRAFLNGRMDLSQAEAVIDLIKAKTDRGFDVAVSQLDGKLSVRIQEIRKRILDLLVEITVNIDYPDEDIEYITYENVRENISLIGEMIENLLSTADAGRLIREGIKVAIVGKPNVGKSSLMNSLLRESRAIVTNIPGTTRDTIEESVNIKGIPVQLIDTAGIRDTDDIVEQLGIEKSKQAFNSADFVIFIVDGSSELTEEDEEIIELLEERKCLVLINKQDLGTVVEAEYFENRLSEAHVIPTRLVDGEGVNEIESYLEQMVYGGKVSQKDSVLVNNVRHVELLEKSLKALHDASNMVSSSEALEFVEVDINQAYTLLGEIIGETVSDDVLNEVFSRFCLGK